MRVQRAQIDGWYAGPKDSFLVPVTWLASYPKSGNTWTRSFLANYRSGQDEAVDINEFGSGMPQIQRSTFDEMMGLPSAEMTPAELQHYRPIYNSIITSEFKKTEFLKTHSAFYKNKAGVPFFSPDNGSRVIHIVRNPLDVAVSYAHHNNKSIDYSIEIMANKKFVIGGGTERMGEIMFDWSGYCRSWIEQDTLPALTMRYEDMHSDPEASFGKMIEFAELGMDTDRLKKAIAFSSFKKLQKTEQESNFNERQPTAKSFFRKGVAGSWRESLTPEQVAKICDDHGEMMERLNYNAD